MKITRKQLRRLIESSLSPAKLFRDVGDRRLYTDHDPYKFSGQDPRILKTLGVGGTRLGSLGLIEVYVTHAPGNEGRVDDIVNGTFDQSTDEFEDASFNSDDDDFIDYDALFRDVEEEEARKKEMGDKYIPTKQKDDIAIVRSVQGEEGEVDDPFVDDIKTALVDAMSIESFYVDMMNNNLEVARQKMNSYLDSKQFKDNNPELVTDYIIQKFGSFSNFYSQQEIIIQGFPMQYDFDGTGDKHIERSKTLQFRVNNKSAGVVDVRNKNLKEIRSLLYKNAIDNGLLWADPFGPAFEQYFVTPLEIFNLNDMKKLELILRSDSSYENYGNRIQFNQSK